VGFKNKIMNVMKKNGLFFLVLLILAGCSSVNSMKVLIMNPSGVDKIDEMVSVEWDKIVGKLALKEGETFVVLNEESAQIPYQVIFNGEATPQSVLFPASALKGETVNYTIKRGKPETFERRTFGRAVPERKDDFAWENDRIGFRMYGPALARENPSNGVDIWLKKTDSLIVNKFYSDELERRLSYHVDRGLGLDCYKVGHTLGAGGIAPFVNDSLWIGGFYARAKVLDSGILRTSFVLEYDSILVDGRILTEKLEVTLDAFSQFNKAVVSYDGDFQSFEVAPGIWLHQETDKVKIEGTIKINKESGYIAYGEKATSDAGLDAGRNYVAVLVPEGLKDARQRNDNLLIFADYKKGDQFTYYFGAGWSQWGFDSDEAWFEYVDHYAEKIRQPLQLTIE
jgi:hypothetical protein